VHNPLRHVYDLCMHRTHVCRSAGCTGHTCDGLQPSCRPIHQTLHIVLPPARAGALPALSAFGTVLVVVVLAPGSTPPALCSIPPSLPKVRPTAAQCTPSAASGLRYRVCMFVKKVVFFLVMCALVACAGHSGHVVVHLVLRVGQHEGESHGQCQSVLKTLAEGLFVLAVKCHLTPSHAWPGRAQLDAPSCEGISQVLQLGGGAEGQVSVVDPAREARAGSGQQVQEVLAFEQEHEEVLRYLLVAAECEGAFVVGCREGHCQLPKGGQTWRPGRDQVGGKCRAADVHVCLVLLVVLVRGSSPLAAWHGCMQGRWPSWRQAAGSSPVH
jgi:hypothetical protein